MGVLSGECWHYHHLLFCWLLGILAFLFCGMYDDLGVVWWVCLEVGCIWLLGRLVRGVESCWHFGGGAGVRVMTWGDYPSFFASFYFVL